MVNKVKKGERGKDKEITLSGQRYLIKSVFFILLFVILSLGMGLFSSLGYLESFRIVFGTVYLLFVPGFILSYLFFPFSKPVKDEEGSDEMKIEEQEDVGDSIDWVERTALSFALSIAIVPLVVFYLNLIGIKMDLINVFLEILGIIVISLIALKFRLNRLK